MKFIFGTLIGMVMGMLLFIGTVGGFIAGIVLGWKIFQDKTDESTNSEEIPVS